MFVKCFEEDKVNVLVSANCYYILFFALAVSKNSVWKYLLFIPVLYHLGFACHQI